MLQLTVYSHQDGLQRAGLGAVFSAMMTYQESVGNLQYGSYVSSTYAALEETKTWDTAPVLNEFFMYLKWKNTNNGISISIIKQYVVNL